MIKRNIGQRLVYLLFIDYNYLFIISILFVIIIRLSFIKIPFFIPDEAQLMTFGEQLVKGGIYALSVVDTRGPGGYYIIGFFNNIFGYGNIIAFRIFALLLQLLIIVQIRLLGRLLINNTVANYSCLFYSVFSYSYILHDTMALNVEILALPFLLASAFIFFKGIKNNLQIKEEIINYKLLFFLCGVLCAIIFSIKQVIAGVFITFICMLFISWRNEDLTLIKSLKIFSLLTFGFIIGIIVIFSYSVLKAGIYKNIYWLVLFSLTHYNPGMLVKITRFGQRILLLYIAQPLLWSLIILWIVLYFKPLANNYNNDQYRIYLFYLLVMQLVGVVIAGQVVGHYFIPSIAFMSIMSGDLIVYITEYFRSVATINYFYKRVVMIVIILIGIFPPIINYTLFPEGIQTNQFAINAFYREKVLNKNNPIDKAAVFIRENTNVNDKIFVLGNLYELYVLSKRVPSTIALILEWFKNCDEDVYLSNSYRYIVTSLKKNSPKIIILPSNDYRGIDINDPFWKDIKVTLHKEYEKPIRFTWNSRLIFFWGKYKLADKTDEWLDIYVLKNK